MDESTQDVESAFADEQHRRMPATVRIACALGIVAFIAFALADPLLVGDVTTLLVARLVIVIVIAGVLAISFLNAAEQKIEIVSVLACLAIGGGVIAVTVLTGGTASRYHEALLLTFFGFGLLIPWRPLLAGATFSILVTAYDIVLLLSNDVRPVGTWVTNNLVLWLGVVIATVGVAVASRLRKVEFENRWQLGVANEKLKALDRVKNEFFANVSHELRTPLTLILAPLEELLSKSEKLSHRDVLFVMRRNAERLMQLIDDLLDLAKLEVGGLRLNVHAIDIGAIAAKVVEVARPTASARDMTLSLLSALPERMPELFGDPHRIEIVVTNLVANALKFTPAEGRIEVRVLLDDAGVAVEVADDGPGIPEADLERIFDRFYQVEASERRRHGGAGIGLALASELAKLHDGKLSVESVLGKGSTFRLWLPAGRDHFRPEVLERRKLRVEPHAGRRAQDTALVPHLAQADAPDGTHSSEKILLDRGRRPRIVVAEDHEDLRAFMCSVLEPDFEVFTANSGDQALELMQQIQPDLVLSDVMMPGVSGHDLCRTIKSDPRLQTTPVILVTARSGSDATLEGYASGADDFIIKPFNARVLVARVRAQLKLRSLALQLLLHARLAAVGTLAAGVAHEARNPLNAILNAVAVLKRPNGSQKEELLEIVDDAARRILHVVSALEEQIRPADGMVVCDLRNGIDATLRLLDHRMAGITVHRSYETERAVTAPIGQLNQVFMNLLDNAIRARPANIWVRVCESDSRIRVLVSDDGPGVPADVSESIFDPFFTTRPAGEGSGLGLYLSRRIVTGCGGTLELGQRSGGGAEFSVELPSAVESAARRNGP